MAKSITYDAGSDRLYCDGGTAEDPITLADVLAADVAGGWGQVTHYAGTGSVLARPLYVIEACLQTGTNSETYVTIDDEVLWTHAWELGAGTHLVVTDSVIEMGCSYDGGTRSSVYWWQGSAVITDSTLGHKNWYYQCTGIIARSRLGRHEGTMHLKNAVSLIDVLFSGELSLKATYGEPTLTRVSTDRITGNPASDREMVADGLCIFEQVRVWRTCTVLIRNPLTSDYARYINIDDGVIREQWTFARPVLDEAGDPVAGATVTITNAQDAEVASYTTNASGLPAATTYLTSREWTGTSETLTNHSPFTLTVAKAGYQTLTEIDTVDHALYDAIVLLNWSTAPAEGEVKAGVGYAEGTREGVYVGAAHYMSATVSAPAITGAID